VSSEDRDSSGIGRVVVFGGTGFLGRRVVSSLAAAGAEVVVATRHPEKSDVAPGCKFLEADVTDRHSVDIALHGADSAVNCVGLYVETERVSFEDVHVVGARNVAESAGAAGVQKLVSMSGIGADALARSAYVRARGRGEGVVRHAFPAATIFRPSVLFGPGDAFLAAIADIAAKVPIFPLFGAGETKLQPVFVDDVALAVRKAIETPASAGNVYELGGPEVLSYRAIVEHVLGWTDRRVLLMPFPFFGWDALAKASGLLTTPLVTEGQVALMKRDNAVAPDRPGLVDLGIEPTEMSAVAPKYLAVAPT
jgi:NADH dehydrogenase